jgi:transcriptional regulator with XRE-family HTH domain
MTKPAVADIDKLIGQRLKMLRQQNKMSAAALADVMESSQQQVSRYELGSNKISAALLWKLAEYFSVPMSWFFLDVASTSPLPLLVNEQRATYDAMLSHEQLAILSRHWPSLGKVQRDAVLKMADAFLQLK